MPKVTLANWRHRSTNGRSTHVRELVTSAEIAKDPGDVHNYVAAGGDPPPWSAGDFATYLPGDRYRSKWCGHPDDKFWQSGSWVPIAL
jgi:hypothetical protein